MRFLSGVVIGALLVIGGAYFHDASIDPKATEGPRQIVNWEAAGDAGRGLVEWMRGQINWLTDKLHAS